MIMISKDVIGIYAGGLRSYARGGRIAAGGGRFAGGPFAAGLIAGGLFASGLNAAPRKCDAIWNKRSTHTPLGNGSAVNGSHCHADST